MPTYLAFHEVDDVEHWRNMPTRDEFFGPLGITHRIFTDPQGSSRVGLLLEIRDFGAFQEAMKSDQAAEAMSRDGVHPNTLFVLEEAYRRIDRSETRPRALTRSEGSASQLQN